MSQDPILIISSQEPGTLSQERLNNSLRLNSIENIVPVSAALKESSFSEIIIFDPSNKLPVGEVQKSFNTLTKLMAPKSNLVLSFTAGAERLDSEFIKKIAKFAGLVVALESSSGLIFNKKIYEKKSFGEPKKGAVSNGILEEIINLGKKENPFAKLKPEDAIGQVDEDALLKNDVVEAKLESDCSDKPRACKNCSCGRSEMEDAVDSEDLAKIISTGQVKSECGSCYLGDAFRCATCPYKGILEKIKNYIGLPAFQPGDKLKLDLNNDGIVNELTEASTKVVGGKVKIEL